MPNRRRTVRMMSNKAIKDRIRARTAEMVVGDTYWLSSFYDKDGAFVQVTSATTKTNSAGWPSSVAFRVVESHYSGYPVGHTGTCNASNLYERREMSSHHEKYKNSSWYKRPAAA